MAQPSTDNCVICGGTLAPGVRPFSSYSLDGEYRIDVCTECGSGTTMPRPTTEELARAYQVNYGYAAHDLIETEKRRRSSEVLRWSGIRTGRILDVGCMFGFLLDEARTLGLETHGIELSREAAGVAAAKGHEVFVGTIEEYARRGEIRFDAIFAQHVLEHVPDPVGFLRTARTLLHPGGRFIVCVPNFGARLRSVANRAWGWYQVPFHLLHFSATGLERALGGAGFACEASRTRGGDTLFLALSAMQALRLHRPSGSPATESELTKTALKVASALTRPYYRFGDDELAVIAHA